MKIKALILAALVALISTSAVALECDQLTGGLGICLPRYGTDFDQWALSDIAALTLINSSAVVSGSTNAYNALGWIGVNRISGLSSGDAGINISSVTTFSSASTVTISGNAFSVGVSTLVVENGRVGIGAASPAYTLEIAGTGRVEALTGGGTSAIFRGHYNTGGQFDIGIENSAGGAILTGASPYAKVLSAYSTTAENNLIQFGTSDTVRMTIGSGGNVGIGTASPGVKLQINGTAGGAPTLGTASGGFTNLNASGLFGVYSGVDPTSGSSWFQAMRNDAATAYDIWLQPSGGNVGIRNASPSTALHVTGTVTATEFVGGGSGLTGVSPIGIVSSSTFVQSGTATQATFNVAYATVTVTLNGGYDLEVSLNCAATAVTDCSLGWSFLYDGANNKFGLGSATGVTWQNSTNTNFHQNISATFPINRGDITSGSHTFGLAFAVCSGNTITWPSTQGSQQSYCKFGVKEIH